MAQRIEIYTHKVWQKVDGCWKAYGGSQKRVVRYATSEEDARRACRESNASVPDRGSEAYYNFTWTEWRYC